MYFFSIALRKEVFNSRMLSLSVPLTLQRDFKRKSMGQIVTRDLHCSCVQGMQKFNKISQQLLVNSVQEFELLVLFLTSQNRGRKRKWNY